MAARPPVIARDALLLHLEHLASAIQQQFCFDPAHGEGQLPEGDLYRAQAYGKWRLLLALHRDIEVGRIGR